MNLRLHSNIVRLTEADVIEMVQVAPPQHAKATDTLMLTGKEGVIVVAA